MQSLRNFLISFAVGLILFGIFAFTIPGMFFPEKETKLPDDTSVEVSVNKNDDETDNSGNENLPENTVSASKTFTAVVGGYDTQTGELDGLLFLKADKENKRFVVATIPTSLSVVITSTDPATGSTVKTDVRIKDFPLKFRGSEKNKQIVDTVHAITGMKVDYYAFFSTNAALSMFEKTNGLYYTVPQDMYYIGGGTEAAPEIDLKAGGQVLNSKQIMQLLRFASYTTDESRNSARRAAVQADFVSEALKQILKNDVSTLANSLGQILSSCETNFTAADFKDNFELISKFSEYSANSAVITVDIADPLEYSYSQKLFENYK